MNPGHVDELYTAYLEETLKPAERERVEQHLRTCARCTAELAEIRQLHDDLRALPVLPLPAGFTVGVRERLRLQQPARQPFVFSWRIAAFTGTLAAAAVFAMVLMPGKNVPSNITTPGTPRPPAVTKVAPETSATVATVPIALPMAKASKPTRTVIAKVLSEPPVMVAAGAPAPDITLSPLMNDSASYRFDDSPSNDDGSVFAMVAPIAPEIWTLGVSGGTHFNLNPTGPAGFAPTYGAVSPGNKDEFPTTFTSITPANSTDGAISMNMSALPSIVTAPGLDYSPYGLGSTKGLNPTSTNYTRTLSAVNTDMTVAGSPVIQNLQDDGRLFASAVIPGAGSNIILEMQGGRVNTVTATALDTTTSKEGERIDVKIDPINPQRVSLNIADSDAPAAVKLAFNNSQNADKFYLFVPGRQQRTNFVQHNTDLLNVRNAAQDFHSGKAIVSNMAQLAQESGMYILCPADFAEKSVVQINDAPALEQLRFLADNLNYRMSVNNQLCNISSIP